MCLSCSSFASPTDAFARIEDWLREHGFFAPGGEELVADLYLGYGLSQTIRRSTRTAPPRAVPRAPARRLPDRRGATWHSVTRARSRSARGSRRGRRPSTAPPSNEVREAIARGDVYQVNLVQHLSAPFSGDPDALATTLAPLRPLHPRRS